MRLLVLACLLVACRERSPTEASTPAPARNRSAAREASSAAPTAGAQAQPPIPSPSIATNRCALQSIPSIAGEIRDTDGRPLCGATVVVEGPGEWQQQYLHGKATFVGPRDRSGAFRVTGNLPGYRPALVEAEVTGEGCRIKTRTVRLSLQHLAGKPSAPPCPEKSMLAAAAGTSAESDETLPDSPIPFVTRVQTEGLAASAAGRLAALQPRFQNCWEQDRPSGETAPFVLRFKARVLASGQVTLAALTLDAPNEARQGVYDCVAAVLRGPALPLLASAATAGFTLSVGFR